MDENKLEIFGGRPTPTKCYELYAKGQSFNANIKLNETVRANENFYIGKQWEGVQANGLPTPVVNILKRTTGFIVATITTDNVKVTASALASTPNTGELATPVQVVNEEFEALCERNRIPALIREFARNAAVDGDGCLFTYWDADAETGQEAKGAIRTEVVENTRVFFGNPNDKRVEKQPWIIISRRDIVRQVKLRAKEYGSKDWTAITADTDERDIDPAKTSTDDDKVTVLQLFWRDDKTKTIWSYECARNCEIREPWNTELSLYPITWLPWDTVQDSYHGEAMITGLIPNQVFINKIWALSMVSLMRTAYPKYVYDSTRVKRIDNRVGSAIGIPGGDITNAIKTIDPPSISPQISQFIEMAITQTEESLGATAVALGDTRPDNTSAIIALQRAASTPTEMTKQNLYQCVEDLFRIYLDFMATYYGLRTVDIPADESVNRINEFIHMPAQDEVPMPFDFSVLKLHPMMLKLDVGASSYYSEIASMQTLDNLLMNGHISVIQYLERIPDGYVPGRRALISELKQTQMMPPDAMQAPQPMAAGEELEIPTGKGFGALQRKVLEQGTTEGLV